MSGLLRRAAASVCAHAILGFARLLTGVRAVWRGTAPEAAPTVYFANHTSHGDFVLVWAALPPRLRARTRPVAAADYWQGSALRRFIGCDVFRALLIERERRASAGAPANAPAAAPTGEFADSPAEMPADPVQAMAARVRAGESLILFPEGTRNTGEAALLPLKSGLYHLARACPELRLVPVWIENLRRVLPKGCLVPVPLACTVDFGAPLRLAPDDTKAAFMARARAALLALRPDAEGASEGVADAPGEGGGTPRASA
jgi:1-acyl-sn-glycerol-3-phosphate acyltransferase